MKIIKLIFLLFFFVSYGQESTFSKYAKADLDYKGRSYAELLQIENKDVLLLKINEKKFIVFEDNIVYRVYVDFDKEVEKKKILGDEALKSFQYLDSLKAINPQNLNVTTLNRTDGLNAVESMEIQDGIDYELSLFKNDVMITYLTYAPQGYIEEKFPFYEQRKKLLNSFIYFNSLFKETACREGCGLMNEILSNHEVSKYLPVRSKKIATLYLVKNNLCCSGFKVNQHYNLMLINEDQIKKRMDYFKITSIKEQFGVKVILLSYPKKNIIFNVFVKDDKVVDIKVENKKSDEK